MGNKAKFCLSATASRNGMGLIAVIMAAPSPTVRFKEASKLLDYGFANCSLYTDNHEDFVKQYVPVVKGKEELLEVEAEKPFSHVCLFGEEEADISKKIQLPEEVEAPIMAGDKIGKIVYSMNTGEEDGQKSSKEIGFVYIVAKNSIERASYLDCLEKVIEEFFLGEKR